ncbi:hypothetical protein D3C75_930650 [compost metagenome]
MNSFHANACHFCRGVQEELDRSVRLFCHFERQIVDISDQFSAQARELWISLDQSVPHVESEDLEVAEVCNCNGHGSYSVSTDIANQYRFSEDIILYLLTKKNPGNR